MGQPLPALDVVQRHAAFSSVFAGALESKHADRLLSSMLTRNSTTLLHYLRSAIRFFDMLDACGHSLDDLQQHVTMDVILCVQEESGDSLAMPLNMVKALRWYVRASLIPFPDLYGGLFLSSTSLGDAPRKEAMPLPLLIVVELERLLLSDFASTDA